MRYKMLAVAGLASILAIGAFAQQQGQKSPSEPSTGMMGQGQGMMGSGAMGGGMSGGMMGGGMMMGMMGQMTTHHQQMTELMTKLMQSMTAIQNEKDPAALKAKMAEHQALLNQMHDQMTEQGGMMQKMSGQTQSGCPMTGATPPAADKSPAK